MCWRVLHALLATLLTNTATASYVHQRGIPVEKTVTTHTGQVIDWVKREVQGDIAQPPVALNNSTPLERIRLRSFSETTRGPRGTVPILRSDGKLPKTKAAPPHKTERFQVRQYADRHWYASTCQFLENHGSSGIISMFKAYVGNNHDFSLLQTAVIRSDVPNVGSQTLEAGWINYPSQTARPHLFTFFTTNAYGGYGDGVSGWNTEYAGWIQYDDEYFPGMELSPLSVVDGDQHDLEIRYLLYNGNWWLAVNGKWVGYYPASIFVTQGNSASATLADHADAIDWYGEVCQVEGSLTTTDMGSGHFASEGYRKAAYIHNVLITGINDHDSNYDGSQAVIVSDTSRYTIETYFHSDDAWGSYFFVGGPGFGGVVEG